MVGSDNGVNRATVIRHVAFDDDDGLQKEKQDYDLVFSFLDDEKCWFTERKTRLVLRSCFYSFSFSFPLFFSFAAVKSL